MVSNHDIDCKAWGPFKFERFMEFKGDLLKEIICLNKPHQLESAFAATESVYTEQECEEDFGK